jgi:hypothetical protein
MKLQYCLTGLIAFAITSCKMGTSKTGDAAVTPDSLTYVYKGFKQRAADCGNKPDSSCTVITLKYPVFSGQKKLNDSVMARLLSLFMQDDKRDTSLDQLAAHFLSAYKEDKQDPKYPVFYTLDSYCKVLKQDSSLLTLETGGYAFEGGAHGASYTYFSNWDTKANKLIGLDDLFNSGYAGKLKQAGEKIFRKDEKLSDTASLANGYFFKDNQFALNNNFLITPTGLRFLYNQYEIKSYAQGTTSVFIPYAQIRSLLRPNTVVSQYIK